MLPVYSGCGGMKCLLLKDLWVYCRLRSVRFRYSIPFHLGMFDQAVSANGEYMFDVNVHLVLPLLSNIKLVFASFDVVHSFGY